MPSKKQTALTYKEAERRYAGFWVIMRIVTRSRRSHVQTVIVLAARKTRCEIYRVLKGMRKEATTLDYFPRKGERPPMAAFNAG